MCVRETIDAPSSNMDSHDTHVGKLVPISVLSLVIYLLSLFCIKEPVGFEIMKDSHAVVRNTGRSHVLLTHFLPHHGILKITARG